MPPVPAVERVFWTSPASVAVAARPCLPAGPASLVSMHVSMQRRLSSPTWVPPGYVECRVPSSFPCQISLRPLQSPPPHTHTHTHTHTPHTHTPPPPPPHPTPPHPTTTTHTHPPPPPQTVGFLERWCPGMEEAQLLRDSIKQLDELFLLVVLGEFNSGGWLPRASAGC